MFGRYKSCWLGWYVAGLISPAEVQRRLQSSQHKLAKHAADNCNIYVNKILFLLEWGVHSKRNRKNIEKYHASMTMHKIKIEKKGKQFFMCLYNRIPLLKESMKT